MFGRPSVFVRKMPGLQSQRQMAKFGVILHGACVGGPNDADFFGRGWHRGRKGRRSLLACLSQENICKT